MANKYFNSSSFAIYNGETSDQSQMNNPMLALETAFDIVEQDFTNMTASFEYWEQLCEDWAVKATDVEPGLPSARTSALAAMAYASSANTSANSASASASAALTSENNAEAAETNAETAATTATTKAAEAAASAAAALAAEGDAETAATTATTQAGIATTKAAEASDDADAVALIAAQFPEITAGDIGRVMVVQPNLSLAYEDISANSRNYFNNSGTLLNTRGTTSFNGQGYGPVDRYATAWSLSTGEAGFFGSTIDGHQGLGLTVGGDVVAASYVQYYQCIEDVRSLHGKVCTISITGVAAASTTKLGVEVVQRFGTGGSNAVYVSCGQVEFTTTKSRKSVTFNLPSVDGKTVGANSSIQVILWLIDGGNYSSRSSLPASGGAYATRLLTLTDFDLHEGGPRPYIAVNPGQDLIDCMRFCERVYGVLASTAISRNFPFKVKKRAVPTIFNTVINTGTGATFAIYAQDLLYQTAAHSAQSGFYSIVECELTPVGPG